MSEAEKSNSSVVHQVPLKKVVSQARGKGQDTSDVLAFLVVEIIDQQNKESDNTRLWISR